MVLGGGDNVFSVLGLCVEVNKKAFFLPLPKGSWAGLTRVRKAMICVREAARQKKKEQAKTELWS